MENEIRNKTIPLSLRYMFRAKCGVEVEKDTYEIKWKYGSLICYQVMPHPVSSKNEEKGIFFIRGIIPNSVTDWGLPYPTKDYLVLKEHLDTIGMYVGYDDKNGSNIFENDIIRVYSSSNKNCFYDYIAGAKCLWIKEDPFEYINYNQISPELLEIVGNVFDGLRYKD